MKPLIEQMLANKALTLPILSFPAVQKLDLTVEALLATADSQAAGMQCIAQSFPVCAAQGMMDLSVEAEAFGATVRFAADEVPVVTRGILSSIDDAADIAVPAVGSGRTGACLEAIRKAKALMPDKPVLAGVIGPYSLAGRLYDMSELMMDCFDSPDEVKLLLEKVTAFLTAYVLAFRDAGADGIILAEPAAGLLSPALAEEFSMPYVEEILHAADREDFITCYHNCGDSANAMLDRIGALPADIIHLGNAIALDKALALLPADKLIMGNVNPVTLRFGTPDEVCTEVERVYREGFSFSNFMISTGCDVPAAAKWENLEAYFGKVAELYA